MSASRPIGAHDTRAHLVTNNRAGQRRRVETDVAGSRKHVTVVGGGLGGVAAALVLAERGVAVTLHEAGPVLGGRLSSWDDQLSDGTAVQMERGFHAFFRQYYNLRGLLRRIDPGLTFLKPCDDYPLFGPNNAYQSFSGLPVKPPFNLMALVKRTPTIGWRDLAKINGDAAAEMLAYDGDETYARFDSMSAADYLDSVRFPEDARRMLFEVFAHSFFNPQDQMSAAEMLMMFHLYFCGSAEGILFDVLDAPFGDAVWRPLTAKLVELGVDIRLNSRVNTLDEPDKSGGVVLAVTVDSLRAIVKENTWITTSPGVGGDSGWAASIAQLEQAPPFAVWRLWLDRDVDASRQPFAGTAGLGIIDNISCVHRYQNEAQSWSARTGGSVIELHGYALPPTHHQDEARIKRELIEQLHALYPETISAHIIDDRFLLKSDCPSFVPGSWQHRPTVGTPHAQVKLAGDLVCLPFPTALMERATTSGFLAANELLDAWNVAPEPIWSIPTTGVLATLQRWQRSRKSN
jgi:carotenoid phi-ring synthase / carotenoid chi-ring synthase